MARYVNPVPGGTVGRTDQGVDISAPPGTPVYAIAKEKLVGIIRNWYQGQSFYYFKEAGSNVYNYVAEQFTSRLHVGQTVQAGQQIGSVAPSGTGLELGWATASGQTLARATTGYTEGEATAAGESYRRQVISRKGSVGQAGGTTDIAQLWIDAGGPPNVANTMAAIAMAESSGNAASVQKGQPYALTGWGLWQITPGNSAPSIGTDKQLLNPLTNARAAVAKYKMGGLTQWATYTSGAYLRFMPGAAGLQYTGAGATYGGTRPGGDPAGGSTGDPQGALQAYLDLRDMPRMAPPGTRNPFKLWAASFSGNWDALNREGGGT